MGGSPQTGGNGNEQGASGGGGAGPGGGGGGGGQRDLKVVCTFNPGSLVDIMVAVDNLDLVLVVVTKVAVDGGAGNHGKYQ